MAWMNWIRVSDAVGMMLPTRWLTVSNWPTGDAACAICSLKIAWRQQVARAAVGAAERGAHALVQSVQGVFHQHDRPS